MILRTCSEIISLAKKLESDSANFYEGLAIIDLEDAGVFTAFARENRRNITTIERVYYGVITDAIEGGFAFNIEADQFQLLNTLPEKVASEEALSQAVEIENTMKQFYVTSAEQSKILMADVPRMFLLMARKRTDRISSLQSLIKSKEG